MAIKWTPKMDALLGTMTDIDLAEHLKLGDDGHVYCYWRRVDLAISAYSGPRRQTPIEAQIDELLETIPDKFIAQHLEIPIWTVHWRRKAANNIQVPPRNESELDTLIGTMPDQTLAIQLGLNYWTVYYRRSELDIPKYSSSLQ